MSNNDVLGSTPRDSSDWNRAWQAVSRLAAVRGTALHETGQGASILNSTDIPTAASGIAAISARPFIPMDHDQLARDIAEIEKASAALRRAEPALEVRLPDVPASRVALKPRSVWILVGGIWISTLLVVAGSISAIVFLLG